MTHFAQTSSDYAVLGWFARCELLAQIDAADTDNS